MGQIYIYKLLMTVHQTITTDDSQKVCDKGQFIVSNMLGSVQVEFKLILSNHKFSYF